MIKDQNGQMLNVGLNGEIVTGVSKSGKDYTAYNIFWVNQDGTRINVKQVFLSDLELNMLSILTKELTQNNK